MIQIMNVMLKERRTGKMFRLDSREYQKQQKECACKQRFILMPLWYDEKWDSI